MIKEKVHNKEVSNPILSPTTFKEQLKIVCSEICLKLLIKIQKLFSETYFLQKKKKIPKHNKIRLILFTFFIGFGDSSLPEGLSLIAACAFADRACCNE
jgi:hypothetical protein